MHVVFAVVVSVLMGMFVLTLMRVIVALLAFVRMIVTIIIMSFMVMLGFALMGMVMTFRLSVVMTFMFTMVMGLKGAAFAEFQPFDTRGIIQFNDGCFAGQRLQRLLEKFLQAVATQKTTSAFSKALALDGLRL